jgi:hypothetical protein
VGCCAIEEEETMMMMRRRRRKRGGFDASKCTESQSSLYVTIF